MRKAVLLLLTGLLLGLVVAAPPLNATVVCTALGSLTAYLQLCKPAAGETGWSAALNNNADLIDANASAAATTVPVDSLTGLGLTYVNTTSLTVAVGAASSDDAVLSSRQLMSLTSATTGTTASTWVLGSNQPKLDTGVIANSTWYHVFVIKRTDTAVVDILYSTSATVPTLPTSYTKQRRIGSFRTNGAAQMLNFVQDGDYVNWYTCVLDQDAAAAGTAAYNITLTVPTGVTVRPLLTVYGTNAGAGIFYLSGLNTTDLAPSAAVVPLLTWDGQTAIGGPVMTGPVLNTDTSARIRARSSSVTNTLRICTQGWIDRRGRG